MEKAVHTQFYQHLLDSNLITKVQHGFRSRRSTTSAQMKFSEWGTVVKKVSTRLHLLCQLKLARIHPSVLFTFYKTKTYVRPGIVMEYACPVFRYSLAIYRSEELKKLQRRAFRIIFPTLSYAETLVEVTVVGLFNIRQDLTSKFFMILCMMKATNSMTYYQGRR